MPKRLGMPPRQAILLNRSRHFDTPDGPRLKVREDSLELVFATGSLDEHPLTEAARHREISQLQAIGVTLTYR